MTSTMTSTRREQLDHAIRPDHYGDTDPMIPCERCGDLPRVHTTEGGLMASWFDTRGEDS